jgi:hypothetical protein
MVAVAGRIVFVVTDVEMTIGATKEVLLLGDGTLGISPSRNKGIRHVQDRETVSVLGSELARDISPVSRKDLHDEAVVGFRGFMPALKVPDSQLVIAVSGNSSLEGFKGLPQCRPPASALMTDESPGFCFLISNERSSWHGGLLCFQ